jgi:hypothetical protein
LRLKPSWSQRKVAKIYEDSVPNIIPYLSLVAAVIGGSIALYIRHKNRTQSAKDAFGVFIREQIANLPQRGVREFYDRTKPTIRDAVQRVWHFLGDERRSRIDRLWREYDDIPARELDHAHEGAMGEMMRKLSQIAKPPAEFQTPYEIVRYYLDEFYKFST